MAPQHTSKYILGQDSSALRRSDRKKTKKIIKDDFLMPNLLKPKNKRASSLSLPFILDSQIRKF